MFASAARRFYNPHSGNVRVSLQGGLVMNTRKRMAASVIALSFAVIAVTALSQRVAADDEDEPIIVPKESKVAVNKMADAIAKGNKVEKDAEAFFKENKE